MSVLGRNRGKEPEPSKVLDVTASMEGSLIFQEPVVLRISGRFEGTLTTRGELTVGQLAAFHFGSLDEPVDWCDSRAPCSGNLRFIALSADRTMI